MIGENSLSLGILICYYLLLVEVVDEVASVVVASSVDSTSEDSKIGSALVTTVVVGSVEVVVVAVVTVASVEVPTYSGNSDWVSGTPSLL